VLQNRSPKEIQVWNKICSEAENVNEKEALVHSVIHTRILIHQTLAEALSQTLAIQLADQNLTSLQLQSLFLDVILNDPKIMEGIVNDLEATVERDPACEHLLEPFLFFKGFHAIQTHRIAHSLWNQNRRFIASILQSASSRVFGTDIHPAATFGCGILLDHATGLVIGETVRIGNNVSMLQGVTLGGTGKQSGDRHPKIGDGVLLSANAQLIGNIKIGKGAKIGAGAVVLTDVPAHTTYAGVPAVQVGVPNCNAPALEMDADFTGK
jgi:serine O-acetyltransferase